MDFHRLYSEINKDIFIKELGDMSFDKYIDLFRESYIIKISDKKIILQKIKKIYEKTRNINESLTIKNIIFNVIQIIGNENEHNQRKMSNFKQSIYLREIEIIIQYLIHNEIFPDFISILLYVAKQRKIIEVLKLNPDYWMFGLLRTETRYIKNSKGEYKNEIRLRSPIQESRGNHLINELAIGRNISTNKIKKLPLDNHAFTYNRIKLTSLNVVLWKNNRRFFANWIHTKSIYIYPLILKMNKLYNRFITSNVISKRLLS